MPGTSVTYEPLLFTESAASDDTVTTTCFRCDDPTDGPELCPICQRVMERLIAEEAAMGDRFSADDDLDGEDQ